MKIGAQLYTLREFCENPHDFSETLKRVADIGYKNIQVSGTCAYEPEWLNNQLEINGLRCVLTHIPSDRLTDAPETVAEEHDIFGCKYIGLGHFGFNSAAESTDCFAERFGNAAKVFKENGKYFMYHNHDHEFKKENGRLILELLAEKLPADEMGFTLDTFWVQAGGADPAQWLEILNGRVPCIHLKDFAYGKKMAVIGEGNINFNRVFEKAEAAGTEYMLVEQDDCCGEDPFDCLKRSYKYLKALGFE